ncbi:3328_t:CDS:2 [Ambispora leptoticha]|uniref:3328_t:CDS:1 n=1 Tax=Ambispora leptoticha TaxID=144679 RepID=A0A9N8ZFJ3_9GLOM|nr:3328_t:CDS:2 [Ambispora leptoticha]
MKCQWTEGEDKALYELVNGNPAGNIWRRAAEILNNGKDAKQCHDRYEIIRLNTL